MIVHPEVLAAFVAVLSIACSLLAVRFAASAPAASIALAACLAAGVAGFAVEAADGPKAVPQTVAIWAASGLGVGGVLGMILAKGRPPSSAARRAAAWTLALTPLVAFGSWAALGYACPLYVMGRRSSYCNYLGFDLLGGWLTGVVILIAMAGLWLALILFVSSAQARGSEGRRR